MMIPEFAPDWLTRWEYAHRGLHSSGVPENSLAAARAAVDAGMGVECDIQCSRDGVPMVFHDWDLDRLSDASGLVEERYANQLELLHLMGTDECIPRFVDLLEVLEGAVPLLIEIKSTPDYDVVQSCAAVAEHLHSYSGDHAVMSFDPRVGEWFAANSSETPRGLVCTDASDLAFSGGWREPGIIEQSQPHFLAMDIRIASTPLPQLWRESRRPLLSWTVRSPELRALASAHVDAMISEGEGLA